MKKNENSGASCPRADIGGQAVLDGVMMKSPDAIAVAVRRPNGDIVVKREDYEAPSKKHPWMGKPFIRGSVNMVQMLGIGMRVLEDSMKMSGNEEAQEEPSKFEKWLAEKLGKNVDKVVMAVAIVMALAMSIGLFVLLPNLIILLFPPNPTGGTLLLKNLVSGIVRIALLIAYIGFVGRIQDGLLPRARPAPDTQERPAVHHPASPLRHQLPAAHLLPEHHLLFRYRRAGAAIDGLRPGRALPAARAEPHPPAALRGGHQL